MIEEQKAKFWELVSALSPASDTDIAEARALETYVSKLIAEAYQAGRADERKAVRLWGVK